MQTQIASWAMSIALLPVCACFLANTGADKRVSEAVQTLNDQARWGRINDAAQLVKPDYREQFVDQHRLWGNEIQLGDTEVVGIQLASNSESASATVNYSWYAIKDMTLHETMLKQQWLSQRSTFVLASEVVVRGDPALLSVPSK